MHKNRLILLSLLSIFSVYIFFCIQFLPAGNIVHASFENADNTSFCLMHNGKQWKFKADDFKLSFNTFENKAKFEKYGRNKSKTEKLATIDRAINLGFGKENAFNYIYFGLNKKINRIARNLFVAPKDAKIIFTPKKEQPFTITSEVIGVELDKTALFDLIYEQYVKTDNVIVMLPVKITHPAKTRNYLLQETAFRGGFSTSIATSGGDRKHNIYRSLNALNGSIIAPDQRFSFNEKVGVRSAANGYRIAKIIVGGEFVDGNGGGVCQTSTTLYNAVLLSGLKVDQANRHSQQVSYVPVGFDAMVNYGTSDLVFTNNTKRNVYIVTRHTSNRISILLFGEALGDGIEFKTFSETVKTIPYGKEKVEIDSIGKYADRVLYEDESFLLKNGTDGFVVKSYLLTLKNEKEVHRKLLRIDTYQPQSPVRVYGAKKRTVLESLSEICRI